MSLLSKVTVLMMVTLFCISFLNSGTSAQAVFLMGPRVIEVFDLPSNDTCESDTPFANPDDCTLYWHCFFIGDQWYILEFECPIGGKFDATSGACVAGTCDVTTNLPTSTTPGPPTTIAAFTCKAAGKFPNPSNCRAYYICQANGSGGYNTYSFNCPGESYFDPASGNCYVGTC